MCDEHVTLWNEKWRISRKVHSCCECGHKIQRGDKYKAISTLYESRWDRYSLCMICDAHWDIFKEGYDGCIVLQGLTEMEHETMYDVDDRFVLLDTNAAEHMKEQYMQDNGQFGVGA